MFFPLNPVMRFHCFLAVSPQLLTSLAQLLLCFGGAHLPFGLAQPFLELNVKSLLSIDVLPLSSAHLQVGSGLFFFHGT